MPVENGSFLSRQLLGRSMFCNKCGKEIFDEAVICVGCGCPVKPMKSVDEQWSAGTMVALVIGSILIPLIGIIFGAIGINQDAKKGQATILLAIGIFMAFLTLIILFK